MGVTIKSNVSANINKLIKTIEKAQKKAISAGLRAGIKDYKATAKPLIPKLAKSTPYRQTGTLQRNLKMVINTKKKGEGRASLFFPSATNKHYKGIKELLPRQRKGATEKGIHLTGPVVIYRNDPFYWAAVNKGGRYGNGKGAGFMKRAKSAGEKKAQNLALKVFTETLRAELQKAGLK